MSELPKSKESQKSLLKELATQLGVTQRKAKEHGVPTLIVIEGLDASAKGSLLNQVLLEIDSRSYDVYSTHASHKEPRNYPLLWRFWNHTPAKGEMQFFDRGPYYLVLDGWAEGEIDDDEIANYWAHIKNFERQLDDSGIAIVKIFLTVPKKIQAKRFEKLEANPKTSWRVRPKDWKRHRQYKPHMDKVLQMVEETDAPYARWEIVDTANIRKAAIKIYHTIIEKLEAAIRDKERSKALEKPDYEWIPYRGKNYLDKVKLAPAMDRAEYKVELKKRQESIHEIVHEIYTAKIPVVLVYCGWDAAGKGGCIKRLVQGIDPRSYHVTPVGAPTKDELRHHYLWRFWKRMPRRGSIEIFDRSWYGRVLVERVESLCSNREWKRSYQEINEMESYLADFGTVILKYWLHIDKETQFERFQARQANPLKQWKITDEDWRNREKWELYEESVNEMIQKTDKPHAPWKVVSSVCKMSARIETIDLLIEQLNHALKNQSAPAL